MEARFRPKGQGFVFAVIGKMARAKKLEFKKNENILVTVDVKPKEARDLIDFLASKGTDDLILRLSAEEATMLAKLMRSEVLTPKEAKLRDEIVKIFK